MNNQPPNILWITSDQQRWDTIHALGNKHIHTPNLDRLCERGTAFTQVYCQNPICQPSRASFMSGLYPSSLGVNRNGQGYFPYGHKVISKSFADSGYTCGLAGKLHLASALRRVEQRTDDGFSYFKYCHSPLKNISQGNQYIEWLQDQGLNLDDLFVRDQKGGYKSYRPEIPIKYHHTTWCTEMGLQFMKQQENQGPWWLSVNYFDPHPPYDAPSEYRNRYNPRDLSLPLYREGEAEYQKKLSAYAKHQTKDYIKPGEEALERLASYYGMVELLDEQVGRLFKYLEDTEQMENTVIIFTSDHGDMMGDHSLIRKGCRFYEGAVRVPLIFQWKGKIRSHAVISSQVELLDLVPTIAELAGVSVPDSLQGESLVPMLLGQEDKRRKEYVRCEYYEPGNPFSENSMETFATMHSDGRYKLIVYHGHDFGELFDLENDPNEHENLWDEPDFTHIKYTLMKDAFDVTVKIADQGPPVISDH